MYGYKCHIHGIISLVDTGNETRLSGIEDLNPNNRAIKSFIHTHQSIRLIRGGGHVFPGSSGLFILKLQHIGDMRSVLHIKPLPKLTFFNQRKIRTQHSVNNPEPNRTKRNPQNGTSENLSKRVVTQINPRQHGEKREGPGSEVNDEIVLENGEPFGGVNEGEVGGEEEHVLAVTRGPAIGIADFEDGAGFRAGLLHGGLDKLVDELRDDEADGEEDALELAAEHEVAEETAEADEDWDEGYPGEEVADGVAALVSDVG